jgi:hypothetical protein
MSTLSGPSFDHVKDLVQRRLVIDPLDVLALYIKQVLILSEGDFHRAEKEVGDVLFRIGGGNKLAEDSAAFWVKVHEFVGSENSRLGENRRSTKDLEPFELDKGAAKRMLDFISGEGPPFLITIEPCLGPERDGGTKRSNRPRGGGSVSS